jgi:hypothetical protein
MDRIEDRTSRCTMTNASPKPSLEVSRAVGVVSVQAGCRIEQAFVLMNERALAMNRTLDDIAVEVIDRVVRFDRGGRLGRRNADIRWRSIGTHAHTSRAYALIRQPQLGEFGWS